MSTIRGLYYIYADSKYCYLNISNHTVGLKEEDINNIFDRFYRADKSRLSKGSGLGLYIVKLLIEKMGGSISSELIDTDIFSISISIPLIYSYTRESSLLR
ncbi:MAG: sensor histidine kinase [Romboutsia sp.]